MFSKPDEHRISLFGFLILITLTLIAGISVFSVMQHQAESMLGKSLTVSLKSGIDLIGSQVSQRMRDVQMIATRPFIADNLQNLAQKSVQSRKDLQRVADSFVSQGLDGVLFMDAAGNTVARSGRFQQNPKLRIPVSGVHGAYLIRDQGFMLHASSDILDSRHKLIGSVVVEAALKLPPHALGDIVSIGKTGEFALCSSLPKDPKDMDCFLHKMSNWEFQHLHRVVSDQALPMDYALHGKSGLIHAKDYRGTEVVAAYAPLPGLSLGAVLKIDQAELYSPVTEQLKYISLLLAALVVFGGLLLHWIITPLVNQLIAGKLALQKENEKSLALLHNASDGIHILDMNGNILEVSDSFCEMLGYSRDEMMGMNVTQWDAEISLSGPELTAMFNRHFSRHEHTQFERRHRRKDGTVFDVEISAFPLQLGGKPVLFNSSRDITERKKKDDELRTSEKRLEELFENMSSGVAIYRAEGDDFSLHQFQPRS